MCSGDSRSQARAQDVRATAAVQLFGQRPGGPVTGVTPEPGTLRSALRPMTSVKLRPLPHTATLAGKNGLPPSRKL